MCNVLSLILKVAIYLFSFLFFLDFLISIFLLVLLLATIINLFLLLFIYSLSLCISSSMQSSLLASPVSWSCTIHQLHLCKQVGFPNECIGYGIKQCYDEAPVLEIWKMWSTLSLPLLPGLLWPRVVTPDRVLSMGYIELFDI